MYPVAKPLALLLDYLTYDELEHENMAYNRGELSALVRIQHEEELRRRGGRLHRVLKKKERSDDQTWSALKAEIVEQAREFGGGDFVGDDGNDDGFDEEAVGRFSSNMPTMVQQMLPPLHKREVDLVEGALKMKTKLAMDVYTPHSHVYAVPDNLILNKRAFTLIYSHGFSRVPVYHSSGPPTALSDLNDEVLEPRDPNEKLMLVGFLITRQLMMIDWDDNRELSTLPLQRPICVSPRMNLIDLFDNLQNNKPLMTFVCVRPELANKALEEEKPIPLEAGFMGIVT